MRKEEFFYLSADKKSKIHAVKWIPDGEIVGVLQISHGVTEYILRYENLAKYFTDKGFLVVGNDHLGHGESIVSGSKSMYFGEIGSWNYVVEDMYTCMKMIKEEYDGISYFLLGFSLGSFVVRTFLINHPLEIDNVILMGTGWQSSVEIKIASYFANKEAKKYGEQNSSSLIHKLTFDTYNKKFKPNKTDYDWLCSSEKNLLEYISDSRRGGDFSSGLFRELLWGMKYTCDVENIKKMNKSASILLISGDNDPVGNFGKGVMKVYQNFKSIGINDLNIKLCKKLRHDILHEDCCKEIYEYLYEWINDRI